MLVSRCDTREWHEGPLFQYRAAGRKISVNVTGSSWPIRGLQPARGVLDVLVEFRRKRPSSRVLDFGAGSWLRYVPHIRSVLPTADVFAVEFDEAFRDDAIQVKREYDSDVNLWTPKRFASMRKQKFDLIILINVLNTMPEEQHRQDAFAFLADRMTPLGWLVVYQRTWAESENPEDALPYGEGWLVPQSRYGYHTFRGKTGAKWFTAQAARAKLKPVDVKAEISSANTFFRVWERPF